MENGEAYLVHYNLVSRDERGMTSAKSWSQPVRLPQSFFTWSETFKDDVNTVMFFSSAVVRIRPVTFSSYGS